ncbi:MAG: GTPase ObgE [Chloroflexota bacterium]|nr:GTPase ObgE [Chloroflexota bacterium]
MFTDRAVLHVRGGDGGRGAISFRREAHVPRGGPDGGDGGRGGSVVLVTDAQVSTLSDLRSPRTLAAKSGSSGAGADRTGRSSADLVVRIPPGTIVRDALSGELIADLLAPGQELVVARGGAGGRGNARFASATHRAPRIAEDGQPGEERRIELELKLIADAGLVGLPNAGKSSLLAALTRAQPKIADYPFTTLSPNLGMLRDAERELVVADIPGLIEGAHAGAGLGEEFLRHVERTSLLVHVVDVSRDDPRADIAVIDRELEAYGKGLTERPRLFALNKIDLPDGTAHAQRLARELRPRRSVAVSAATGDGVAELARAVLELCPARPVAVAAPPERRIELARTARDWSVRREDGGFRVRGDRVERLAGGIDWDSPDAAAYFQGFLARSGIARELRALGVRDGDMVKVGKVELEWQERNEP